MTVAWVLGSHGVLGSALGRSLRSQGSELFLPAERFCWACESTLASQIAAAVRDFSARAARHDRWEIYWAAGIGTMNSAEAALAPETRALSLILRLIGNEAGLVASRGAIAFASSAGAIYAGCADDIITENSAAKPTTPYAHEKIRQEELLRSFARERGGIAVLIARISTIYGPGQSSGKQQGLLAHVARNTLRHKPIQIYVPYDTIRDYIYADDAATQMVGALNQIEEDPRLLVKIVASECPVSIAQIVSAFKRIVRRTPRIVTSANRLSSLYSRRVQFRSVVLQDAAQSPPQGLIVGISKLMAAERMAFATGKSGESH